MINSRWESKILKPNQFISHDPKKTTLNLNLDPKFQLQNKKRKRKSSQSQKGCNDTEKIY